MNQAQTLLITQLTLFLTNVTSYSKLCYFRTESKTKPEAKWLLNRERIPQDTTTLSQWSLMPMLVSEDLPVWWNWPNFSSKPVPPLSISKTRDQETRNVDIWEEKLLFLPVNLSTDWLLPDYRLIFWNVNYWSRPELTLCQLNLLTLTLTQLTTHTFWVNVLMVNWELSHRKVLKPSKEATWLLKKNKNSPNSGMINLLTWAYRLDWNSPPIMDSLSPSIGNQSDPQKDSTKFRDVLNTVLEELENTLRLLIWSGWKPQPQIWN